MKTINTIMPDNCITRNPSNTNKNKLKKELNSNGSYKNVLLTIIATVLSVIYCNAQCPNYAPTNYFDTTCYKYLPTELKVGQGRVGHADLWGTTGARAFDFYIPAGREEWAIAVVHAWQVERNILKYSTDVFNWHSYFGTLLKESFGACDPNLSFAGITRCSGAPLNNPFINLDNYTINNGAGSIARVDGCFQIDNNTGWPVFPKYYPHRWTNKNQHTTFMAEDNFATAALSKMYYQLAFLRYMEYVKGYPVQQVLTSAPDYSAGSIWVAMSYNKGFFDGNVDHVMSNAAARTEAMGSNNWLALVQTPALNYDYTRAVSHVAKVLSNNYEGGSTRPWSGTGWTSTADNQWHCWFDRPISWTMMQNYMNKFFPLYPEVNSATVTAKVKAVFDGINGGSPISFRYEMAPVIDEFVINMPYDDPMQGWLYSTDGNSGCGKGTKCIGPEVTLKALGSTIFCQGYSVELETIVGTGYTYQWTKDGVNIANPNTQQNIFFATQSGSYGVKVTTSSGCTIESDCKITVTAENCSNCTMTATANSTNNSCSGVPDGSVSVSLANTGGNPVTYKWTGPVSGNTATITNVPDGTYLVEVTSDNDPGCKAFATVIVNPNKKIYQQLSLSSDSIDCNTADLNAAVIDAPPASCAYQLRLVHTGGNCYGFWDKSTLSIIALANNNNLLVSTPRANGSGDCNHLNESITVPHNATLEIQIKKISGSNVTGPNFRLELINPQGNTVWTYSLNGKTYSSPTTSVYTVITNCTVPMPVYSMSWSPTTDLTNIVYGSNTASARASVSTTRSYTIFAQHPSEATCKMAKSVTVVRDCPGELPVEWLSFEAELNQDKTALLTWSTLTEINADQYFIERSNDGFFFEPIGSVNASGNSSHISTYKFIDGNPGIGTVYYRIRQTDKDGSFSLSNIEMISIAPYSLFKVYPNPVHNHIYIENVGQEVTQTISIKIEELTGKALWEKEVVLQGTTPFEISNVLSPGIYILKIRDTETEHTFRILKQ